MSINWVMLSDTEGFTPLPGEQRIYTSPPRTTLTIQTRHKYGGKENFTIQCNGGCAHITNRRIVYLPTHPSPTLESFAAPILNLQDTHVTAPFFGPNVWTALVIPVPGGGLPLIYPTGTQSTSLQPLPLEIKLTFKDGGAFDFHTHFERIKERLQQAVEAAREAGNLVGSGGVDGAGNAHGDASLEGVDLTTVHLDELPAYEEQAGGLPILQPASLEAITGGSVPSATHLRSGSDLSSRGTRVPEPGTGSDPNVHPPPDGADPVTVTPPYMAGSLQPEVFAPPVDPPPGYEEAQRESVVAALERRFGAGDVDYQRNQD